MTQPAAGGAARRRWFGTDGVRGRAGQAPLLPGWLEALGRALGEQAGAGGLVLIARDTRESGPEIVASVAGGLLEGGARVLDLGLMPTAGLPVAMRARAAAAGLVVSASHNPWMDNGLKVFGAGGLKLSDEREAALEERIAALLARAPEGRGPAAATIRALDRLDGAAEYSAWLLARFSTLQLRGRRLLVDCANGAATVCAPPVLARLGGRVTALFDRPDGRNINAGCGSTHLDPLVAAMAQGGHDLGLAFDGDADRVLLVDRGGRTCNGDHLLGFLAPVMSRRGELPGGRVIATVMSNLGLERTLAAAGLSLVRTPVGDRHVLAAMEAHRAGLGGEASGHILFPEGGAVIGDGLYTALRLLAALEETGADLAAVIDAVPHAPQVLLNVPVARRPPVESLPRLQARVSELGAAHGSDLRLVLRYSGTENLARVMVEGLDRQLVHDVAAELAQVWASEAETVRP